jgi:hypothetical protein
MGGRALNEQRLRWLLYTVWCLIVLFAVFRHEYWRDEVRAFAFARDSRSISELFLRLKDEGHPMLWHLLLYTGYSLTKSRLVLPFISFGIAATAVALLVFKCPLKLWLKALFVLGGFPLYEYSVVARNYGISMLLLFLFAYLYPNRKRYSLVLGTILACLANTNIHSLILASLLMAFWLWDDLFHQQTPLVSRKAVAIYAATAILMLGIVAALFTLWPTDQILPSDPSRYNATSVLHALLLTLRDPAYQFKLIAPRLPGVVAVFANLLLVSATLGLIARPALLVVAWMTIIALSILFEIVYPGGYRHQGLFIVFLLTLHWMALEANGPIPRGRIVPILMRVGVYFGLPILLVITLAIGSHRLWQDLLDEQSSSRKFGTFLNTHPEHATAILIGEPDFYLESVSYYVDNPIYIVREQRFGDTVRFTRASAPHLGLGQLLRDAWAIHLKEGREVLIALGHVKKFDPTKGARTSVSGESALESISYSYGRTFTWSALELAAWRACTSFVASYAANVVGDEQYNVYKVSAEPP